MSNVVYMTRERVAELENEIRELKTKARAEIAQKIADARSHGDLSENADYDAAKHEQELLEIKINKLESTLGNVKIIESSDLPDDGKVYILSTVKLLNKKVNKPVSFTLVSAEEADFEKNKLSVTSPLGKALLGKQQGDVVETKAPVGIIQYEILEVGRSL
ncbi:MAG: transcription elongation factor GreA [Candidatus Kapabacteria bacterium]|nr:transcription elongation factor GreA [Candidatus Kapabacteria bacterium]